MTTYLLDANVFIQAKNLHYGFDFCPAFWGWLDEANARERVFSIEKVGDELLAGAGELSEWARQRNAAFFLKPDAAIVPSLQRVSAWAAGGGYEPAAVTTFLQVGDYYLVAHAHAHGFAVVTHEVPANSTKKIKIPNPCIELGIKCITPYEMLRLERARFVLGADHRLGAITGARSAMSRSYGGNRAACRSTRWRSSVVMSLRAATRRRPPPWRAAERPSATG